jgi:hypothetical protein
VTTRDRYLRRLYGLTEAQWVVMFARQGGACAICRRRVAYRLHTDHDHKTGRVRGLLCFRDNHRLLGRGLEDPALHDAAAAYLRSAFDGRDL